MDALRESPDMMAMDVEDQHLPGSSGGISYPTTRRSVMKPQQPLVLRGQQPKVKEMNKEKEEKASPPMKKEKKERTSPPPQKLATQTPRDGRLHIKVDSITQEELNEHIRLYGEELEGLSIHVTAARNEIGTLPPCLSFCGLKFPRLESLELRGVDLTFIEMKDWEFPQLMSLEVHHCYAGGIDLMLSSLRDLHLTYVELGSSKDLGPSLARCPALETISTYKLLGLGGYAHFFTLPACTILDLYRSDDLESLDVFAPRLQSLNLQACYCLERVRLHPHGFNHIKVKSYTNRASRCTGGRQRDLVLKNLRVDEVLATLLQSDGPVITSDGEGSAVLVRLLNARVDPETLEHLRQHPRVGEKAIELFDRDDPERTHGRSAWEADWLLFGSMGTTQ